ncbi:MAG: nucleotide exchange factor GrpE [Candidatus Absconditabacterales bacterium]
MTQDQKNTQGKQTEKHSNQEYKSSEIHAHISDNIADTELEPSATQDIEHNLEQDLPLDDSAKNELINQLKDSNESMKAELEKITRIATTSQSQYISLKYEFDSYIKRIDTEKKEIKLAELKKIVNKFSKLLEQLRLFFQSSSNDFLGQEEIKGLQLIYESFLGQELAQMGVFQIQSLGLVPDSELHEVLMIQEATQDDLEKLQEHNIQLDGDKQEYTLTELSGHIIGELEVGYYYFDGEKKVVIKPSKVLVAQ